MIEITKNSKLFAQYIDLSTETKFQYGDECDIVALKFDSDIEKSKNELIKILPGISKPIMICGCGKDEVDSILLPELIKLLDRGITVHAVILKLEEEELIVEFKIAVQAVAGAFLLYNNTSGYALIHLLAVADDER